MISARFFSVKNIAFIAGIVILLLILPKITGIVMLFFAAYVIACAMDPFVEKLQAKLKNNRTLAAVITVFGGLLALFALFAPIIAIAYKEIKTFIQVFPDKIMDAANYVTTLKIYGHKIADLVNFSSILDTNPDFAHSVFSQSWNITIGVFQFFVVTVAIGMIIFYLLVDKEYLIDKFQELSNAAKRFGGSIEDTAATLENLRTARLDIAAGGNGGGLKETAVKQGITISDDPEQTLENIARKMETLQTEAQKLDLAKSMGIDEGTARLLSQGVERYREELQRAKKYQLFTKEDIERMREYRQVQSDIRLGLQNIFGSIWRMLLPAITQVAKVIRSVTDWLAEHEGAVKIIATITAVIIAVAGLAAAVQLLNAAFALVAANPVVLTILAIAAAIGLCIVAINDFIVFMQGGDSVIGRILEKWGYDTDLIRQDLNKLGADIKAWFATWLDGWRIIGEWIDSTRAKLKAFWDSLPEPLKKMITGGIKTALLLNPTTAIPAAGVMAGQKFMERYKKNDLNAVSQSAISTSYQTQSVNNNAKNNAQSIINNDNSNIRKISGSTNSKRVNIQKVEINTQASDPQAIANLININAMSNLDNGMRG